MLLSTFRWALQEIGAEHAVNGWRHCMEYLAADQPAGFSDPVRGTTCFCTPGALVNPEF